MTETSAESNTRIFLGARGFEQADLVMASWQKAVSAVLFLGVVCVFAFGNWQTALFGLNALFTTFFLLSTLYRVLLIDISLKRHNEIQVPDPELQPPHGQWPRYVVQVPLYKEPQAVGQIVAALGQLDYPQDRLSIQLLIEADDTQTREALTQTPLEPPFCVVDIPVSYPRTKPKACNVGLARAHGDYLVVYDAEDRPEADQLKKAVLAFARCPANVVCIQAKLSFYNSARNPLTRCFTAEYAMWFDLCLPGLDALRAPIPLGGTSNHFKLSVLKELKGWDEYNVTEDCDLGLRLFARGYRTRILDSTTWEEACPRLPAWFRQRSRWVKGYIQTYFVHTRHLGELTRRLGFFHSLHFHLLVGGSVLAQLLNPVYWTLTLVWIVSGLVPVSLGSVTMFRELVSSYFPWPIFVMAALCLFLGNFIFVYSCAVACTCRGFVKVVKYTPLMIVYWFFMSLAAWKGALQLLWKPHYWEKTQHLSVGS